jgi:hypothetical protein
MRWFLACAFLAATAQADTSVPALAIEPRDARVATCAAILRSGSAGSGHLELGDEVLWGPGFLFIFGEPTEPVHGWRHQQPRRMRPVFARVAPHAQAEMEEGEAPQLRRALDQCFDLAAKKR